MSKKIILGLLLLLALPSFGQQLLIEALYYDPQEKLAGIERKYMIEGNEVYVYYGNSLAFCIKRNRCYSGDTTILNEEYYTILEKSVQKKYQDYLYNDYMDDEESEEENRLPLILNNTMTIPLDSLFFEESRACYFVNGFPIKAEDFNSKHQKHILVTGIRSTQKITYHHYFMREWPTPYATDTVSWNKDSTVVTWHYKRVKWEPFITKYVIHGKNLTTIYDDTIVRQVEYLYGKNIFSNLFTSHLLYNDLLYVNDLLFFERRPEVRITSKKNATIITYCYDHKKRVIESEHRNNGQYIGKTLYRYIEE